MIWGFNFKTLGDVFRHEKQVRERIGQPEPQPEAPAPAVVKDEAPVEKKPRAKRKAK